MDIKSFIQQLAGEVKNVSGVKAVVLGGSRARGTNHSASDVDLGITRFNETAQAWGMTS